MLSPKTLKTQLFKLREDVRNNKTSLEEARSTIKNYKIAIGQLEQQVVKDENFQCILPDVTHIDIITEESTRQTSSEITNFPEKTKSDEKTDGWISFIWRLYNQG